MDDEWMVRAEFDDETKAFFWDIKELYEGNRLFKLLYDHRVIDKKVNYVLALWGHYYVDAYLEEKIPEALTFDEYEQLSSEDESESWESKIFSNIYQAKGDEDPQLLEGDKLVRYSQDSDTPRVYRELSVSNVWKYISFINYDFTDSNETNYPPGRGMQTMGIDDIDFGEALETVDWDNNDWNDILGNVNWNQIFAMVENDGSIDLQEIYDSMMEPYYDDLNESYEQVQFAYYKLLPFSELSS